MGASGAILYLLRIMAAKTRLAKLIGGLEGMYGRPTPVPAKGPFELVLWENVAYLVGDARRRAAFEALKATVGTRPRDILAATDDALYRVTKLGGMHPERRARTLREIAERAEKEYDGKLESVLKLSTKDAIKTLRKFPSIGEPGAEKILLLSGALPTLALDSNGLRVLLRIGYGKEEKSYASTYRSVREAVEGEVTRRIPWMTKARELLRRHGQEICKRSAPRCELCAIRDDCRYGQG